MLLNEIYETKQEDMQFWKYLLECMKSMYFERNKADTFIYFKWKYTVLALWLLWTDNSMI